jgi:cathepsin D
MHFLQCLLSTVSLASTVTAFVPYSFHLDVSTDGSASNDVARRFVPYKLLPDDSDNHSGSSSKDVSLTLDLKKLPVRRDNNYKVVMAEDPTTPSTAALNQEGLDYSYFATVKVGSKDQQMWMVLDTGGPHTWVFGSNCTTEACQRHETFGEVDSTTLKLLPLHWAVGYGTGSVSGVLGNDSLSLAGLNVNMVFGLANDASKDFESYAMDGILGLGRSANSNFNTPSFMDTVAAQHLLKSNIIGFSFSRNEDGARDGAANFGDVDTTRFTGDIVYTNTTGTSSNWRIPLDDASVNGTPCRFINKTAVIDTGSSYVMLPPKDATVLHNLIPGATTTTQGQNFTLPCDSKAVVQMSFSGISYSISPKDYVGPQYGSACVSTIVGQALDGDDVWLLGDVFLKNVYSVFDYDNDRIGFANRSVPTTTSPTIPTPTAVGESATAASDSATAATKSATDGAASTSPGSPALHTGSASSILSRFIHWPAVSVLLCMVLF